jgi:hypothetical protein|tara:strand:- start:234 stop:1403 length:1170 start_codon:yes stop_codon:yes gene_type:complete
MKIYSIEEIVKATNNYLNPKPEALLKKNNATKKIKLSSESESIIIEAEKSILQQEKNIQNVEKTLVLKNEISTTTNSKINSLNYKIKIKPELKDHMINELYLYLKRKVTKNTLKLIIEEQEEIKNLKNKINFLKQIENKLKNNYEILKNQHESALEYNKELQINKKQLNIENKELKINNDVIQNDLNEVTKIKEKLDIENKELKINNDVLQNDINEVGKNKENLDINNKKLKINLKETKKNLKDSLEKNRSFEINSAELKNTLSRYIVNSKKIQEKLNLVEESKNLKLEKEAKQVKFYQDENIRLSSELLSTQKKNEITKENLNNIEIEKEKISNKIKDLNKSIEEKTNIISSPLIRDASVDAKKNVDKLDDKEQKSLDEAISRIFAKI